MIEELVSDMQNLPLVLGVDIGGTQIRAAVLRGATLLSRVRLLTGEDSTPDRVIPRICVAIQQALTEAGIELEQVRGIGVGSAGQLDSRTGVIFSAQNLLGWDHVPLRDELKRTFINTPLYVENDANVAALGEYLLGAGRGCSNIVYLTISTGIGGGIVIDGQLLRGVSGTAGELGHMTIDWRGGRCTCGNNGCLEYLASGTAIARCANEAIAAGQGAELLAFVQTLGKHNAIDARIVGQAAEAGVPLARSIITQAAEALGAGMVNIIHIFNPERIILGGGVTKIGPMFLETAAQIVNTCAIPVPRQAVQIVQAQLGEDAGLIGAGALIYLNENEREGIYSGVGH